MQAVALDDSDVTVWYHLGIVALKTFDLCLARRSFEEVCSVCTRKLKTVQCIWFTSHKGMHISPALNQLPLRQKLLGCVSPSNTLNSKC